WLRGKPVSRGGPRRTTRRRVRLQLEPVEDRTVPSTITPTTTADGIGIGSLRDAIIAANAAPGHDTINIRLSAGTYNLTIPNGTSGQENAAATGDLDITTKAHKVIIHGKETSSSSGTVIQQGAFDRVFQLFPGTDVQ